MSEARRPPSQSLLTVAEAAERLHVPAAVVLAAVDAGVLPHLRDGSGQLRFDAHEISGIEIRAEK